MRVITKKSLSTSKSKVDKDLYDVKKFVEKPIFDNAPTEFALIS